MNIVEEIYVEELRRQLRSGFDLQDAAKMALDLTRGHVRAVVDGLAVLQNEYDLLIAQKQSAILEPKA